VPFVMVTGVGDVERIERSGVPVWHTASERGDVAFGHSSWGAARPCASSSRRCMSGGPEGQRPQHDAGAAGSRRSDARHETRCPAPSAKLDSSIRSVMGSERDRL